MASIAAALLAAQALAVSAGATHDTSIKAHALKTFGMEGSPQPVVVVQSAPDSPWVVGFARLESPRMAATWRESRIVSERMGVLAVFKASGSDLHLVDSSPGFELTSDTVDAQGLHATEVAVRGPDRFSVHMKCHQCKASIAGQLGTMDAWFHFAWRDGRWVLAGLDREVKQIVGGHDGRFIVGVVEHLSENYRTGLRTIQTFRFDKEGQRMQLTGTTSSQGRLRRVLLRDFDPVPDVLGRPRPAPTP